MITAITAENFRERGGAYIKAHDDRGFLIARTSGIAKGIRYHPTLRQWWAWRNYRVQLGLSCVFMDRQGKDGRPFTVPCEWPHDFDPNAPVEP